MTAGDQRKASNHWTGGELTAAATRNGGHRTRLTNEGNKKVDMTGQIRGGEDKLEATPEIGKKVSRTIRVDSVPYGA